MKTEIIGNFSVTSGKIVIADPFYCMNEIYSAHVPVNNGIWQAFVKRKDDRIITFGSKPLGAAHSDDIVYRGIATESSTITIVDEARYQNNDNAWYDTIQTAISESGQCGIFPEGCAAKFSNNIRGHILNLHYNPTGIIVGVTIEL